MLTKIVPFSYCVSFAVISIFNTYTYIHLLQESTEIIKKHNPNDVLDKLWEPSGTSRNKSTSLWLILFHFLAIERNYVRKYLRLCLYFEMELQTT